MTALLAGRYALGPELGRGGLGVVHRATDHVTGHEVAVSLTPLADPPPPGEALRLAERGRALTRLRHPGLVAVLDHGIAAPDDGPPAAFVVMAIVPGRDLTAALATGPLAPAQACRLIADLARALGALHAQGWAHRDVKAANVRLTPGGQPVLVDVGLLAPLGEPLDGGAVSGTPAYMAPEAIAGGAVSPATDFYALGCLAHELLAGRPPFLGSPAEVLRAQLTSPPPPLDVPAPVAEAVAALLRKAPQARPADAEAIASAFEAAAGLPPGDSAGAGADAPAAPVPDRLVGREAELATLAAALDEALAGHGAGVVVAAPAGVGKSRLVAEAVLAARLAGVACTAARCRHAAAEPLQAVREAWAPLIAALPPDRLADLAADLAPVLPGDQAGRVPGDAHDGLRQGDTRAGLLPGDIRTRLHAALARVVAEAAPLLVVIDDVQWGDSASLDALTACMRATTGERVLWLSTCRPDEAPPGHAAWHAVEEGLATTLPLQPLARPAADALLAAALGDPSPCAHFASQLFEATAGNAFFAIETLRHLAEEGALAWRGRAWRLVRPLERVDLPEAAEAAVLRRAASLPADAAALLQLAAVCGPRPDRAALAAASGLPSPAWLAAIETLLDRGFLASGRTAYRWPHDRLREAVYGAIPVALRQALHRRCGEALEAIATDAGAPATASGATLAALAHHFTRGADPDRGLRYALAAGDEARAAGMPAQALAVWQAADAMLEAVEPGDPAGRRQPLWWALGAAGFELQPDHAAAALERLLARLPAASPRRVEAEAFLASAHGFGGRPHAGLAAAARAHAGAAGMDAGMRAAALMVRGPSLLAAGRIDELVATAREAATVLATLDLAGQPPIVRAARVGAISYAMAAWYQGAPPPPGVLEQALEAASQAGAVNLHLTIRHYEALAGAIGGRFGRTEAYLAWAGPYGRRTGARPHPWLLFLEAFLAFQRGDLAQAQAALDRAARQPQLALAGAIRHQADVLAGRVRLRLGAFDEARRLLTDALADAEGRGLLLGEVQARLALGELETAAGRWPEAEAQLAGAERLVQAGVARNPLYEAITWRHQAALALARGDAPGALALAHAARRRTAAEALDQPLEHARAGLVAGEAHLALGDPAAAAEAWHHVATAAQAAALPHEAGQATARLEAAAAAARAVAERWSYLAAVLPAAGRWPPPAS